MGFQNRLWLRQDFLYRISAEPPTPPTTTLERELFR